MNQEHVRLRQKDTSQLEEWQKIEMNSAAILFLKEKKTDLAALLSEEIIRVHIGKTIVTTKGFLNADAVKYNYDMVDLSALKRQVSEQFYILGNMQ